MALNFAHYRKTNYTDATGGYSSIKKKKKPETSWPPNANARVQLHLVAIPL
jgi:hypothetical protein